jgi:hypothetical protein
MCGQGEEREETRPTLDSDCSTYVIGYSAKEQKVCHDGSRSKGKNGKGGGAGDPSWRRPSPLLSSSRRASRSPFAFVLAAASS